MDEVVEIPELNKAIERTSGIKSEVATVDDAPVFRVIAGTKIPISKHVGGVWHSRIQQAQARRKDLESAWSEAIRYYDNDQMSHRNGDKLDRSGNTKYQRTLNEKWSETENVVFSNIVTMLPILYAQNPSVEISPMNTANADFAKCAERLLNAVMSMKFAPGLHLKSKARRAVLWALLTNNAYTRIDFVTKEQSNETVLAELNEISDSYAKATSKAEIKELEGKLMALEEKVAIASPSGPKLKLVNPFRLYWDFDVGEPDHSDALWAAEWEFMSTSYINAVFAEKKDGKLVSVYEPTHILKNGTADDNAIEDENSYALFEKETEHAKYGYNDKATFQSAQFTKVWWIWDKVTRRLLLFADNRWDWPLWVWNDPLKLLDFFPYAHLWFHETVEGSQTKGEVTHYLDQQDAINDINSTVAVARTWARTKLMYNKNVVKEEAIEAFLNADTNKALGVDVPEGSKIGDHMETVIPPALKFGELFQPETKFAAINRITGITAAQRGAEFRTNTTNEAIDFYQKNSDIRVDEKVDAIEDWIAVIAWQLLQLLGQHYTREDVAGIIGAELAEAWEPMPDPNVLRTKLNLNIVGGSTDKPTSKVKKKMALELGQVLGQFANAIPATGIVALRLIERAFVDDVNLTEEDWKLINDSMQQTNAPPEAPPTEQAVAEEVTPEQEQQLNDMIAALSPEQKQQLQELVQSGVAPSEALQQITSQQ